MMVGFSMGMYPLVMGVGIPMGAMSMDISACACLVNVLLWRQQPYHTLVVRTGGGDCHCYATQLQVQVPPYHLLCAIMFDDAGHYNSHHDDYIDNHNYWQQWQQQKMTMDVSL